MKYSVPFFRPKIVRGGHGPTLLLLHGYPQTWYSWNGILPALARHYTCSNCSLCALESQ